MREGQDGPRSADHRVCYLCGTRLVGAARSGEHIILNALGGRHRSYDLLCRRCNDKAGSSIDAELSRQLLPYANLLGFERDRKRTPNVIVERETGEQVVRDRRGNMRPPRPSVSARMQGSKLHVEASAGTVSEIMRELRRLKRRYPTLDLSDVKKQIKTTVTPVFESTTFRSDQIGGDDALRAVAKIAANFAVWKGHIDHPTCASFISGTTTRNEVAWWWVGDDPIVSRPAQAVLNIVGLAAADRRVVAYVELLHVFQFGVVVEEAYDGPSFSEILARDVMTGRELELCWDPSKWEVTEIPPAERIMQRLAALMPIAEKASHDRVLKEAIDRAFKRTWQEYGTEATGEQLLPILLEELQPLLIARLRASGSRQTDVIRGEESNE